MSKRDKDKGKKQPREKIDINIKENETQVVDIHRIQDEPPQLTFTDCVVDLQRARIEVGYQVFMCYWSFFNTVTKLMRIE